MLKPLDPSLIQGVSQSEVDDTSSGSPVIGLNIRHAAQLGQATEFEFPKGSGKVYVVDRIPYAVGIELNDLFYRIHECRKHDSPVMLPIYERQLRQCLRIMWGLIQPKSKWARFKKKYGLLKMPRFQEGEIAELLGFFLVRRMTSNVSFRLPADQRVRGE